MGWAFLCGCGILGLFSGGRGWREEVGRGWLWGCWSWEEKQLCEAALPRQPRKCLAGVWG